MSALGYRPLRLTDWRFCYELALDPEVRAVSLDTKPPTWWGHMCWMWRWTSEHGRQAYVLKAGELRVGLVRGAALHGGGLELGIVLTQSARGAGLGYFAIKRLSPVLARVLGGPVYAQVKLDNLASLKAFGHAGYRAAEQYEWEQLAGERAGVLVLKWEGP